MQGNLLTEFLHEDWILDAYWNSDETLVITSAIDNSAKVWTSDGQLIYTFTHDDWVDGTSLSNDESTFLTWSRDGFVKLWDMESGKLINQYSYGEATIKASWNDDESLVLICGDKSSVDVWNPSTDEVLILDHGGKGSVADWIEDDSLILSASLDGSVIIWDLNGNKTLNIHQDTPIIDAIWSSQNHVLVTNDADGRLIVWSNTMKKFESKPDSGFLWGWHLNNSETQLMTMSSNGTVKIWDIQK